MRGAQEALDKAIAKVTKAEYDRLTKDSNPCDVVNKVNDALKSLNRLREGGMPDYNEWDAPFYISWYQPRQVNLVYAALMKTAPRNPSGPLLIIDVGCGAWASMIALAIFWSVEEALQGRMDINIRGIDPSEPMTRLGEKLFLEFVCEADDRKLAPIIDIFEQISIKISSPNVYFNGNGAGKTTKTSVAESWLLTVHALYDKSQVFIKDLLVGCRQQNRSCLSYELITSDGSKKGNIKNLFSHGVDKTSPQLPVDLFFRNLTSAWKGSLNKTTTCRKEIESDLNLIRRDTSISTDSLFLLKNEVAWNPSRNRIEEDAVWVRRRVSPQ